MRKVENRLCKIIYVKKLYKNLKKVEEMNINEE